MTVDHIEPPRLFRVGINSGIEIRHCADIALAPDEQVTFVTPAGSEYDVVRKTWGYYATPSLNGRLPSRGLHPVLVRNERGLLYLVLMEAGAEEQFFAYLAEEGQTIILWLDGGEHLTGHPSTELPISNEQSDA